MKKLLLTSCLALGLTSGLFANTLDIDTGVGLAAVGSNKLNLNNFTAGSSAAQWADANVYVSFVPDAQAVTGAAAGLYAAPWLSGGNGTGFGAPNQPNGANSSVYLSTGVGSITFEFTSYQNYFGLLWGSVDDYNTLEFFKDGVSVGSVSGIDVAGVAQANGNQGVNGTFYVNIFHLDGWFDTVVATSSDYAFEIDNIAYNSFNVPDSSATVALLGLSLACLVFFRRKA